MEITFQRKSWSARRNAHNSSARGSGFLTNIRMCWLKYSAVVGKITRNSARTLAEPLLLAAARFLLRFRPLPAHAPHLSNGGRLPLHHSVTSSAIDVRINPLMLAGVRLLENLLRLSSKVKKER